jgi:hypothetical protein
MDELERNNEIFQLLNLWAWCSRALHVKWERSDKYRNSCLAGINFAVNESRSEGEMGLLELCHGYQEMPFPLFNEAGLLVFWRVTPSRVLEIGLGCFTKGSPLGKSLNRLRLTYQDNGKLDKLYKKMTSREERYGPDWPEEGHHPESELVQLRKEITTLYEAVERLILKEHRVMEALAREILSQGIWRPQTLPASWSVRKTPESLLNRSVRLKLWQVAQEISYRNLDEEKETEALCNGFYQVITPAVKAAVESQGYTVDNVVDDFLNFDRHKSREEITK